MSEFHKAFYLTCPMHRDVEHPFWRECPKCEADKREKEIVIAAKNYAGFDIDVDPDDYDERYFQKHKCEIYDAFLKGSKHCKTT